MLPTIDSISFSGYDEYLDKGNTMALTPWAAAKAAGDTTYISDKACPHGHGNIRNTANGACRTCANEKQRLRKAYLTVDPVKNAEYQQKWNASSRAYKAKMRWKEKDPKNAWACSAVGGAKARATKYGVPFDLDKAYICSILTDICPVFGQPFVWYGNKLSAFSPSLDRIVPSRGYVRGNVVVISQRANAIKSDATAEEIQAVADWLRLTTQR